MAWLATSLLATIVAAAEPGSWAGMSLGDALDALRRRGLKLVYSSAVVREGMRVVGEPASTAPRAVLDEILAAHGLAVREGPGGQLVVVRGGSTTEDCSGGSIQGRLVADADPALLASVVVRIADSNRTVKVGADGAFTVDGLAEGTYALEFASPLFLPARAENIRVVAGRPAWVRAHLVTVPQFLEEIVVTPSRFRILDESPAARQFLSRADVDRIPKVADDALRVIQHLPGTADGDFSAISNIRGGDRDEVLVLLDGMELYEPFHLKDFQNMFSSVDGGAIGGVEFLTGGFPVEYGDRLSGVMEISTSAPTTTRSTVVELGTMYGRVYSDGVLDDGRGQWLVSARGWHPDSTLDLLGATKEEVVTDYYDVLARVQHDIGSRSVLSAGLLAAYDDVGFASRDEEETEAVRAHYRSHQAWLNVETDWTNALSSRTVVAGGRLSRQRDGAVEDLVEGDLEVSDARTLRFVGLKQDWAFVLGDRQLLKFGFDARRGSASYDYSRVSAPRDADGAPLPVEITGAVVDPSGESYSLYFADRLRIAERVVLEAGARWDSQSWIAGDQFSPRVSAMFEATPLTTLRASWGRYSQTQRLNELPVEDGVTEFFPAQRADHWLASLEHRFAGDLELRLEVYHKELDSVRPRYENLFNPFDLFPEAAPDRVLISPEDGRSRGVEVLLKGGTRTRLSWWVTYALSSAEDEVGDELVPRSWDQRHAGGFGVILGLPRGWELSLSGTAHSGWPTTGVSGRTAGGEGGDPEVELVYGPRNGERLPPYYRFDLRAAKRWVTRNGEVAALLQVLNVANRKNVCCVEDFATSVGEGGTVVVVAEDGYWAPMLPSLGVRWRF